MALEKNSPPVFVKWTDILRWLLQCTEKFPKRVRFTLASRIDNLGLDILERIIEAIYSKEKAPILIQCNLSLEKLRVLLRFSFEGHLLSIKQYEYISQEINEAGKMIGGWYKQASGRSS